MGLRSIGRTVAMVTTILLSLSLKNVVKLVKYQQFQEHIYYRFFLSRNMLINIMYWIK